MAIRIYVSLIPMPRYDDKVPCRGISRQVGRTPRRLYRAPGAGMMRRGSTSAMVCPVLSRTIQAAGAGLLVTLAACQPMQPQGMTEAGRYLVYFNEFSANLSRDA